MRVRIIERLQKIQSEEEKVCGYARSSTDPKS